MENDTSAARRYVGVREFLEMATSSRKLYRVDEAKAGLCGLLDPATGTHVVVEQDKLLDARVTGSRAARVGGV